MCDFSRVSSIEYERPVLSLLIFYSNISSYLCLLKQLLFQTCKTQFLAIFKPFFLPFLSSSIEQNKSFLHTYLEQNWVKIFKKILLRPFSTLFYRFLRTSMLLNRKETLFFTRMSNKLG